MNDNAEIIVLISIKWTFEENLEFLKLEISESDRFRLKLREQRFFKDFW